VLIQRGRGGGLAGAFGGMGGQSAFGTKAGDVFTRITVIAATCWILLCILAINVLGRSQSLFSPTLGSSAGQAAPSRTPSADGGSEAPQESQTPAGPAQGAQPAAATESPAASSSDATTTGESPKQAPDLTIPRPQAPEQAVPGPSATGESPVGEVPAK